MLITLLVDLTKSARMHKHANETRAGAGNSDSCSRLNAATDAAAPGRAFQRRGRRCRRRRGAGGNTLSLITQTHRTKKPRHVLNARHRIAACNAGSIRANPCLTPPFPCTACAAAVWMGRTCERSRDGAWCCQGARTQDPTLNFHHTLLKGLRFLVEFEFNF